MCPPVAVLPDPVFGAFYVVEPSVVGHEIFPALQRPAVLFQCFGEPLVLLHHVDQSDLLADRAVVVAYSRDWHMCAVWQAGAVNQDTVAATVNPVASRSEIYRPGLADFFPHPGTVPDKGIIGCKESQSL